jgi:MauM/NapG family ferredoxin protein
LVKLRRLSQVSFLGLFLLLLFRTEFHDRARTATGEIRLDYPVRLVFELDPLAAVANAIASHALYRGLLWALAVIVPTLFLGRVFCGWVCPLGTIHHYVSWLKSDAKRGKRRATTNRYGRWQTAKYYLLFAALGATAAGAGLVGWLDPFSLLVRSLGLSILPAVNYAMEATCGALEHSGLAPLQAAGNILHAVLAATVLDFRQPYFSQGVFIGLIFVTIVALNLRIGRLWCRALCPLGALLAITSRWSLLGLGKNAETCNGCNACLMHCQGGAEPVGGEAWRKSECLMCFACAAACPQHSLQFGLIDDGAEPDLGRRKALTSVVAGIAAVPLLRSTTGYAVATDERLLRPPGSLDEGNFLDRCLRCGACMKVCPNNALQPAVWQAGLEGLWTPVLVPHIGYCEPSCVLCSQTCPTGAIWELSPAEKGWIGDAGKPVRLGTAFYDRGRCLPWAMGVECIVCQEWCPTSPKAIILRDAEVVDAAGNSKIVRQPSVDPAHCVGCGCCEYACVLQDRPAIYVTSIGESRSRTNQLLLSQPKGRAR